MGSKIDISTASEGASAITTFALLFPGSDSASLRVVCFRGDQFRHAGLSTSALGGDPLYDLAPLTVRHCVERLIELEFLRVEIRDDTIS